FKVEKHTEARPSVSFDGIYIYPFFFVFTYVLRGDRLGAILYVFVWTSLAFIVTKFGPPTISGSVRICRMSRNLPLWFVGILLVFACAAVGFFLDLIHA
ncbi:MAG: hypothetical protein K8F91_20680, partial [Candidatus Obscuribacterales bacterium]|nr:hypothetical protein [Candidatus Obscuribacterales bacterium]